MTNRFPNSWSWDCETMVNTFTVQFLHVSAGYYHEFEISDFRDDRPELLRFLNWLRVEPGSRLVGFNSVGFDYPIIHDIMVSAGVGVSAASCYAKAQQIIYSQDRFATGVAPWDVLIPQLDLFKIHHFNNKAKGTGLKALQFNMRSESVEEMPYPAGSILTREQVPVLKSYNFHDVTETLKFYWLSKPLIDFRDDLTERTGRDHTNLDDTSIGKKFFIDAIERVAPGTCYIPGKREPRQSHRPQVTLRALIFPYVRFTHPEFNRILTLMQATTVDGYNPQFAASCVINGFKFDFGVGGIHGSVNNRTLRADDTHCIFDLDVAGFYPDLAIRNQLRPEHLGDTFVRVYAELAAQRKLHAKGTPENAMLKLANNGVYGDSGNPYSPFYDPQYMLSVTVNGQLLLCMLAEAVMQVPSVEMIQVNTDGMTMRVRRDVLPAVRAMCQWWMDNTLLTLEENFYGSLFIRDVNAYLAVDPAGKVKKRKNAFSWVVGPNLSAGELAWHQDHSALIVPMAAEAHMLKDTPIASYVTQHREIFDFCIRAKVNRGSRLELGDGTPVGNLLRYYISTDGQALFKVMPPTPGYRVGDYKRANSVPDGVFNAVIREIGSSAVWDERIHTKNRSQYDEKRMGIDVGYLVQTCNHIGAARFDNINYQYYISAAEALVASVGYIPQPTDGSCGQSL